MVCSAAARAVAPAKSDAGTKLVLLGTTGAPYFIPERKMIGQAVVIDGRVYLIDAGYGVAGRMVEAHLPFEKVAGIFVTHMHADHIADFPIIAEQIAMSQGISPVGVFGPEGIRATCSGALETFTETFKARQMMMQGIPAPSDRFAVTQIAANGVIFQDDRVEVSALAVPHPPIPSYAYRFDSQDRSIVFSGDTRMFEGLAEFAKGADVLVHEAIYLPGFAAPPYNMPEAMVKMATSVHTTPEQAGQIAQQAGVKTLVLSHLIPGQTTTPDSVWHSEAAKHFKGRIIVGHDLMVI
ncbi:MBL fold metallo-hydrolase [Novosphingobium sp. 2580]|uniref:MBL fold metallo-hydrolase n=2 Tax=Novosphingobium album (ex Hu et al. 2023) TaxID=2930093 RepID=A0ABT0B6S0_9SPHN|nr:MBL fold metallo-hydrolase [Novosphingobium album (ex Hu et al. 2023)]